MEIEIIDKNDALSSNFRDLVHDLLVFSAQYLNLSDQVEVSVTIVDNEEIRQINRDYRGKDYATDVISFAMRDVIEEDPLSQMDMAPLQAFDSMLGDLIISIDKVKSQAKEYGHSQRRELAFLVVHGFLHLNGYDHHSQAEEEEMFQLQEDILAEFGVGR